jgi:hypothetical protein
MSGTIDVEVGAARRAISSAAATSDDPLPAGICEAF